MKVQVTLTFDLPGEDKKMNPFLLDIISDHTLRAAIKWHCTQASKWLGKEGEKSQIYIVHNNWSEFLTAPNIDFKAKVIK